MPRHRQPHHPAGLRRRPEGMGDETRSSHSGITRLLGEKCVTALTQTLLGSQPQVSHHLRMLREAGLAEGHRHGKQVCYRVEPAVQRALKNQGERVVVFGCCQ